MRHSPPSRSRAGGLRIAALAVCAALLLVAAAPAAAVTRRQAANKALASLGSRHASDPVVVFGLRKPLRKGTRVTLRRANGPTRLVLAVRSGRAFFFYEDATPFSLDRHHGRVVLVGAKNGKVTMAAVTAPLLAGGALPVRFSDPKAGASLYRVYYSGSTTTTTTTATQMQSSTQTTSTSTPQGNLERPNSPPKADRQDARAKQNAPKHIHLTGSDDDGDFLTFVITKQPDHGTLSSVPPDVIYTPAPDYLGHDSFAFKTYDDIAQS